MGKIKLKSEPVTELIMVVCEDMGVNMYDLLEGDRRKEVIEAKKEVSKVLREWGYTYKRIGMYLGITYGAVINLIKKKKGNDILK